VASDPVAWLTEFAEAAQKTDKFIGRHDHVALLAAGLLGEAGSVVAELKKRQREREAYPAYRRRMLEEIGDFAWYFIRIISLIDDRLVHELETISNAPDVPTGSTGLPLFLEFGTTTGSVVSAITDGKLFEHRDKHAMLRHLWILLLCVCRSAAVDVKQAIAENVRKTTSRFSDERIYGGFFDEMFPEEEQLPRRLNIEFRERSHGQRSFVVLRCNGINFGDRITDNIQDPDWYRYHDIFHFSHAAHLGWSPVIRALLRCKRKSNAKVDEAEDGARAVILEEAIAAVVFSRAKQLRFFEGIDRVDYDLLKLVKEFVDGYEVQETPLWQWEIAILDGYRVFRQLRENRGGHVILNMERRELIYTPLARKP
jgi:NTP pyrophosphatase (non-canonical NTP hydrolase)